MTSAHAGRGESPAHLAIWPLAAVAFLVLGLLMQMRIGHCWTASRVGDDAVFNLPPKLAGWERLEGEGTLNGRPETDGLKSHFWIYRLGDLTAGVALDYPFSGYHDATICYRSAGWDVANVSGLIPASARQIPYLEATLTRQSLMRGLLLFGLFDEHGAAAQPDAALPPNMGRLRYAMELSRRKAESSPTYQVQTLTLGYGGLSEQQRSAIRTLFMEARNELTRQVGQQAEGKS